jgi:methylated-DNA-[protein]-cysteine S-methyltransferase
MNTESDLTEALQQALIVDSNHLGRLHQRLAVAAEAEDLLDVAYRTVDSPVGSLLLAATDTGLVRVAYADEDHDRVLQDLSDRISPRILHHPTRLDAVAGELDEYFAGRRRTFSVTLDWRLSAGFRATVLHHLRDIEYGHTASYATVAQLAGRPKAFRAVGTACATNPLPVVVPCHRVVKSDGSMGGYLGGSAAKATLLELEAAA